MSGSRLAGLFVVAVLVVGAARPAAALPILDPPDADALAAELAGATAAQGICYGWRVAVYDEQNALTSVDLGSSRGAGLDVDHASCPRWMVFEADLTYTPSSSETEDSATFRVTTNVPGAPDEPELRRVGITGAALLGAQDDIAVINATLSLPALATELGLAPAVPVDPNAEQLPPADVPTGEPGSDWTRSYGHFLALAGVLVGGGLLWAGWAWAAERYGWNTEDGDNE